MLPILSEKGNESSVPRWLTSDEPSSGSVSNSDALDGSFVETGVFESMDDTSAIGSAKLQQPNEVLLDDVSGSHSVEAETVSGTDPDNDLAFLDGTLDGSMDLEHDNIIDSEIEVVHEKDALTEELERQADTFLPDVNAEPPTLVNQSHLSLIHI